MMEQWLGFSTLRTWMQMCGTEGVRIRSLPWSRSMGETLGDVAVQGKERSACFFHASFFPTRSLGLRAGRMGSLAAIGAVRDSVLRVTTYLCTITLHFTQTFDEHQHSWIVMTSARGNASSSPLSYCHLLSPAVHAVLLMRHASPLECLEMDLKGFQNWRTQIIEPLDTSQAYNGD